jgi:hypothetical protein
MLTTIQSRQRVHYPQLSLQHAQTTPPSYPPVLQRPPPSTTSLPRTKPAALAIPPPKPPCGVALQPLLERARTLPCHPGMSSPPRLPPAQHHVSTMPRMLALGISILRVTLPSRTCLLVRIIKMRACWAGSFVTISMVN